MTDEDPVPLKAGGEATPELVRALYALGRRDPDVARLARVAEKLGAAIADLPPPGSTNGIRRLIGTKTLITGLVIGIAALSWFGYRRGSAPAKAPPPSATESSSVDQPPARTEVASNPDTRDHLANTIPAAAAGSSEAPHASVATSITANTSNTSRRALRRAVPTQPSTAAPSSQPTLTSPATVAATTDTSATTDTTASLPSTPAASSAVEKPAPAQKQRAAAQPASAAQPSELELLLSARKAMSAQPAAALRLLDEHATRFPSGLLGPEREVLTIEALRKLGRTAEATQRLRKFESRYPDSIHLRRLQGNVGAL
jgi:hypothetical protein